MRLQDWPDDLDGLRDELVDWLAKEKLVEAVSYVGDDVGSPHVVIATDRGLYDSERDALVPWSEVAVGQRSTTEIGSPTPGGLSAPSRRAVMTFRLSTPPFAASASDAPYIQALTELVTAIEERKRQA